MASHSSGRSARARRSGGVRGLRGGSPGVGGAKCCGRVGPRGGGKPTLVTATTGSSPPQQGRILYDGGDITGMRPHRVARLGIARTFQNLALFRGMSVLDNILMGRHIHMHPSALATLFYWWWAQRDEIRQRRKVEEIIDFLQLESVRDEPIDIVPLGLHKRVELPRALPAEPRFLILDEPMAGMNQEEKEYMARFILHTREAHKTPILLIYHPIALLP